MYESLRETTESLDEENKMEHIGTKRQRAKQPRAKAVEQNTTNQTEKLFDKHRN